MISAYEAHEAAFLAKTADTARINELVDKYLPSVEQAIKTASSLGLFYVTIRYDDFAFSEPDSDATKIMYGISDVLRAIGYNAVVTNSRSYLTIETSMTIRWGQDGIV